VGLQEQAARARIASVVYLLGESRDCLELCNNKLYVYALFVLPNMMGMLPFVGCNEHLTTPCCLAVVLQSSGDNRCRITVDELLRTCRHDVEGHRLVASAHVCLLLLPICMHMGKACMHPSLPTTTPQRANILQDHASRPSLNRAPALSNGDNRPWPRHVMYAGPTHWLLHACGSSANHQCPARSPAAATAATIPASVLRLQDVTLL